MGRVDGSEPRTCSHCGESSEEFYFPLNHSPVCGKQRKQEIDKAVAEERERCAKVAKSCWSAADDSWGFGFNAAIEEIVKKLGEVKS